MPLAEEGADAEAEVREEERAGIEDEADEAGSATTRAGRLKLCDAPIGVAALGVAVLGVAAASEGDATGAPTG